MKKRNLKWLALIGAAVMAFSLGACSSGSDDDDNGKSTDGGVTTAKTYTEASDAEKARFTVTYDAERLSSLSHASQTLTDAITVTASEPWMIEEYGDMADSWALLSTEKSDATTETTTNITLHIEDNLAEFYASLTYDEYGTPNYASAVLPDDRATTLHLLNAAGKRVAAIRLIQRGNNVGIGMVQADIDSSNHQFVGRGYDIFKGAWANPTDVKKSIIIDPDKMKAKGRKIEFQQDTNASYDTYTGKTLKELTQSFEINASVSTEIFKFKGEVKASYGSDYKETGAEEYAICTYKARRGMYWLDTSEMVDCAVDENADGSFTNVYLSDGAFKAIYGLTSAYKGEAGIKKLIDTYGTHVIVSGIMGGRRDFSMRMNKSEIEKGYEIKASVEAGYKSVWGSVNLNVDSKYSEHNKKASEFSSTKVKSVGGSTDLTLSESAWQAKLTDDNAALMEFEPDSLVPIWELCQDAERAKAIRKYVAVYGGTESTDMLIGSIVLKDGSLASPSSYTIDASNPAVGVIAYVGTGGQLGRKDTVYMLGLKQEITKREYKEFGSTSYGYGLEWLRTKHPCKSMVLDVTSDNDGIGNFAAVKKAFGNKYSAGDLPAMEWADNYGNMAGLKGTRYETGWFLPSRYELITILTNYELLNKSLGMIAGANRFTKVIGYINNVTGIPWYQYPAYMSSSAIYNSYLSLVYVYIEWLEHDMPEAFSAGNGGTATVLAVYPIPLADLSNNWSLDD